ncbi:hypothetical protein M409DRAFT_25472 [Zasmidium cellare ATCC 36951]|uniref:BTB domain-containing protein n=1 Tax=Zasmidium cellare ATCC 36951 TaxID=1080233 RepID=A0A6A6CFE1_ZASCE|nr:uncharacterized protein M409DRAFT_25472 [Zasmidium cellare ATCC 36951]KAF2164126.1 hypothetical protein M409DRAFT_25472 [Zasmidium cellare ATCC 36951]
MVEITNNNATDNAQPEGSTVNVTLVSASGNTWQVTTEALITYSEELYGTALENKCRIVLPQKVQDRSVDALIDHMSGNRPRRLWYPREFYKGNEDIVITAAASGYTNLHYLATKYNIGQLETEVLKAFEFWFQNERQDLKHVEMVLAATADEGLQLSAPMMKLVVDGTVSIIAHASDEDKQKWQTLAESYPDFAKDVQKVRKPSE